MTDFDWELLEAATPRAPGLPTDMAHQPARDSPAPAPAPSPSHASLFLRALPSELLPRILSLLPPNDLAGSVRLVCRDALHACHEALLMQHAALMPSMCSTVPPPLCCCAPTPARHLTHHHLPVPTGATQSPCNAATSRPPASTTAITRISIHASKQQMHGLKGSAASEGCPLCPRFTIRLSQPVPHAIFAWRWAPKAATQGLTVTQRLQLWHLTVATEVLQNVRVLRCRTDGYRRDTLYWQSKDDFTAAARSGNVGLVRLLSRTAGYRKDRDAALEAAAAAGRTEMCCWLLSTPSARKRWQDLDVRKSLFEFHDAIHPDTARCLLVGAAAGLPLGVLTFLYGTFVQAVHRLFWCNTDRERTADAMLRASASSTTSDWQAKAAWVLGEFFSPYSTSAAVTASEHSNAVRHDCTTTAAAAAATAAAQPQRAPGSGVHSGRGNGSRITGSSTGRGRGPWSGSRLSPGRGVCTEVAAGFGALPRLLWLQEQGCPLDPREVLRKVVCASGDADVLTHLLQDHDVVPGRRDVQHAACFGHLEVLQVLLQSHTYGRGTAGSALKPDGGGGRCTGGEGPEAAAGAPGVGGGAGGRGDGSAGEGAPRAMAPGERVDDQLQDADAEMRGWFRRAVLSAAWCGQVHVLAWLARARRELLAEPPQQQQTGVEAAAAAAAAAVFPTAQEVLSAVLWDDAIGCPPTRQPLANSREEMWGRERGRRGGAASTHRHPPGLGLPEVWSGHEWWKRHFGSSSSSSNNETGGCDKGQQQQQQHRRERLVLLQQTPEQRVLRTLLWLRHEGTWWPGAPGEVLLQRTWRAPDAAVEWLRAQGMRVERDEVRPKGGAADDGSEEEEGAWWEVDVYSEPWPWSVYSYGDSYDVYDMNAQELEQQKLGGVWCVDGGREVRRKRWGLRRWREQGRRRAAVRRAERWWRRLGAAGRGGKEGKEERAGWRDRLEGWVREGWDEEEGRWREGGWGGAEEQADDGGEEVGAGGGHQESRADRGVAVRLEEQVVISKGTQQQPVAVGNSPVRPVGLTVGVGHGRAGLGTLGGAGGQEGSELDPGQVGEARHGARFEASRREEAAGRMLVVQWRRSRERVVGGRGGAAAVGKGRGGGGGARHGRWAAWIGECVRRDGEEAGAGAGWWWYGCSEGGEEEEKW